MNNYNYTIYAAYRWEHPESLEKFFESENDCLRWCNKQNDRFGCKPIFIEPDSAKILKEHILRSKAR